MTTTNSDEPQPTGKQLAYLKSLAQATGQSFTWPRTRRQASAQINRLKNTRRTGRVERQIEADHDNRPIAEAIEDAAVVRSIEVQGYGSDATWRQRS